MENATIKIKNQHSFRKIVDKKEMPVSKFQAYSMVVDVEEITGLELDEWRDINPREANEKSGVSKKIRDSLIDHPEQFLIKNRGLTLLVDNVSYDQKSNDVTITLTDKEKHGILDGGHTYQIIKSVTSDNDEESKFEDAKVLFQLIELPKEAESDYEADSMKEIITEIVSARNTSAQVKDESLLNLRNVFDPIKKVISDKEFAERIAYNENETNDDGNKKDISVKDILSYIKCFDIETFNESSHPIPAYSGKAAFVKELASEEKEDAREKLKSFVPLLPKILELYDTIYIDLPETYNGTGGKFGGLQGVTKKTLKDGRVKPVKLNFILKDSEYQIPTAFIYPILASFRVLVRKNSSGDAEWIKDPIQVWKEVKTELSNELCEQAKEFRHPTKLGKNITTWKVCYKTVELYAYKNKLLN